MEHRNTAPVFRTLTAALLRLRRKLRLGLARLPRGRRDNTALFGMSPSGARPLSLAAWLAASVPDRLEAWRRAALAVLWVEYAIRLLWLPASLATLCMSAGLLGLVPAGVIAPLLLLAVTAAAVALPLRRVTLPRPTRDAAERRLELDTGLPHRPFATLADTAAHGGSAPALWALHTARARAALARLRLRLPRTDLAARDPYALRAASLLLLVTAVTVAGPEAPQRLLAAYLPGFGAATAPITVQAWVEPPAYTGLPIMFLPAGGGPVTIPDGATLKISIAGGRFTPRLALAGHRIKLRPLAERSWQGSTILHDTGSLTLRRLFGPNTAWDVTITPNDPPEVNWSGPPMRAGTTLETRFPWHVAQRYGVASLSLSLRPELGEDSNTDLPPIVLPVPLPGAPKDATGALQSDLSAHPYAGVKMRGVLTARDASGQLASSAPAFVTLPERPFKNTLARAVIELRRRLALRQESAEDGAGDLQALTPAPKTFEGHTGLWLNTQAVIALLRQSRTNKVLEEAEARLWIIALDLDGALPEDGERALAHAREDLRKALADRAEGKITDQQLVEQLRKLQDALAQRLAEMAKKAAEDGKLPNFNPHGAPFHAPALEKALRDISKDAREGRLDQARRRLAELEKLLEKLPQAKVLTPEQARQAQQANQEQKKRQDAVKDMIQREAGLMDHAQARAPRPAPEKFGRRVPQVQMFGQMNNLPFALPQFAPPNGEAPSQDAAPPPPPDSDQLEANEEAREADAKTQRALRQALTALQQAVGPQAPPKLNEARKAMGEANEALMAGNEPAARAAEGRAIDALRQGSQQMQQQADQNAQLALVPGGGDPQSEAEESGDQPGGEEGGTDPLGRPLQQGTGGHAADDNTVHVPDEMEQGRSRAIQEELRRRGAERARPKQELDYIDRLLQPFQ